MPTVKQQLAVSKTLENGGNITKAMKEVGYKDATVNNPKNLTDSEGFKLLMAKYLDDDALLKVHTEGLKARRKRAEIVDRDDKGRPVYEYFDEPDYYARHKYLDTAYKIKGKFNDPTTHQQTVNFNFINQPEVQQVIQVFEQQLEKLLTTPPN